MEEGGLVIVIGLKNKYPLLIPGCKFGDKDFTVTPVKDCSTIDYVYVIRYL